MQAGRQAGRPLQFGVAFLHVVKQVRQSRGWPHSLARFSFRLARVRLSTSIKSPNTQAGELESRVPARSRGFQASRKLAVTSYFLISNTRCSSATSFWHTACPPRSGPHNHRNSIRPDHSIDGNGKTKIWKEQQSETQRLSRCASSERWEGLTLLDEGAERAVGHQELASLRVPTPTAQGPSQRIFARHQGQWRHDHPNQHSTLQAPPPKKKV